MAGVDPGASDDQDDARHAIADIQRSFLRLTALQTLLSFAGVFTGAVALYAALTESQAVREQSAASVWPYVQFMIEDHIDAEGAHFAFSFHNVGVGPARMRGMRLRHGGQAVLGWDAMAAQVVGEATQVGVDYGQNSTARRVLSPGESVTAFSTQRNDLALAMQQAVYSGAVALSYCYCSIFDQCWTVHTPGPGEAAREPVPGPCPGFGEEAFVD